MRIYWEKRDNLALFYLGGKPMKKKEEGGRRKEEGGSVATLQWASAKRAYIGAPVPPHQRRKGACGTLLTSR
jgi:hypothetical protein